MSVQNFKNIFQRLFSRSHNKELTELLGFTPGNIELYHQALNHKSTGAEEYSNERLEFLGDAVLSMVVSTYLYRLNVSVSEGELSKQRSKLVSRSILNRIADELRIEQLLNVRIGESDKPKNIYGNALEAIIGAVYLDKGIKVTSEFVLNKVLKVDKRAVEILKEEVDFKSRVIEWSQSRGFEISFHTSRSSAAEMKYDCVLTLNNELDYHASGESKKQAEQLASEALYLVRNLNSQERNN